MSNGTNEIWHRVLRMRAINGNSLLRFLKLANIGEDVRKLIGPGWIVRKQEPVAFNALQL
jgi:hypothetical protein